MAVPLVNKGGFSHIPYMRTLLYLLAASGWFVISAGALSAAESKAGLGRLVWSAFECAGYADMAGYEKEHTRLWALGLSAGREFVEALNTGEVTKEEITTTVPIGITGLVGGASTDSIVGRFFESD